MNKHTSSVSLIDGHIEDAKVIKALKICGNIINADCKECSYEGKNCVVRLIQSTNDLINRQKAEIKQLETIERVATKTIEKQDAEIERLTTLCTEQNEELCRLQKVRANILKVMKEHISQTKSEAIQEFSERLTDKADLIKANAFDSRWAIWQDDIDNLVKEMTE